MEFNAFVAEGETRTFSSGIEISNRTQGSYDIRTGEYNTFVPRNFNVIPLLNHEGNNDILSGEALFLPNDRATSIILGRNQDVCDVKIDVDFESSEFVAGRLLAEKEIEALSSVSALNEVAKKNDLGEFSTLIDPSDTGISRVTAQLSRHPNGVTTITHLIFSEKAEYDTPRIIRDNKGEMTTIPFRAGSVILKDGDTVLLDGSKRIVALRFFDKNKIDGGVFDKPTFIKQSFRVGTQSSEIYDWIYKKE